MTLHPPVAVPGILRVKVLSLRPPWGLAVVRGLKPIETRTWRTKHRGLTVIHHSLTPDPDGPWHLFAGEEMTCGAAIGSVNLMHCRDMEARDVPLALCGVTPGRQAWETRDPFEFVTPFPMKGQLNVFDAELPARLWASRRAR